MKLRRLRRALARILYAPAFAPAPCPPPMLVEFVGGRLDGRRFELAVGSRELRVPVLRNTPALVWLRPDAPMPEPREDFGTDVYEIAEPVRFVLDREASR